MIKKINLELKHFCSDFSKIRLVLKKLGAKKEIVKNQTDYYFNLPTSKGRLKLRIEGKRLTLVYYERPNFEAAKETASKIELYNVKDRHLFPFLQKSLGVKAVVKKKREVWRKTNTVFHLDAVKSVGNIFEIELQKNGKITEKDRKIFRGYQKKLLPVLGGVIKGSNVDLVSKENKDKHQVIF